MNGTKQHTATSYRTRTISKSPQCAINCKPTVNRKRLIFSGKFYFIL